MITAEKLTRIAVVMEQARTFIGNCDRYDRSLSEKIDLMVDLRLLRYDIQASLRDVGVVLDVEGEQ